MAALLNQQHYSPYIISLVFYALTICVCELLRRIIFRVTNPSGTLRRVLIELIATLQVCTAVYENGLVLRHYGVVGFFVCVSILIFVHGLVNRGAHVIPCVTFEAAIQGTVEFSLCVQLFAAQLTGGYLGFRLVKLIWKLSSYISLDHAANLQYFKCVLPFKVPFVYVCLYELVGCFLIRSVIGSVNPRIRRYVAPVFTATMLAINVTYIGAAALNPIIASARFLGCDGLKSTTDHLIIHWCCALIGWLLAAYFTSRTVTKPLSKKD